MRLPLGEIPSTTYYVDYGVPLYMIIILAPLGFEQVILNQHYYYK